MTETNMRQPNQNFVYTSPFESTQVAPTFIVDSRGAVSREYINFYEDLCEMAAPREGASFAPSLAYIAIQFAQAETGGIFSDSWYAKFHVKTNVDGLTSSKKLEEITGQQHPYWTDCGNDAGQALLGSMNANERYLLSVLRELHQDSVRYNIEKGSLLKKQQEQYIERLNILTTFFPELPQNIREYQTELSEVPIGFDYLLNEARQSSGVVLRPGGKPVIVILPDMTSETTQVTVDHEMVHVTQSLAQPEMSFPNHVFSGSKAKKAVNEALTEIFALFIYKPELPELKLPYFNLPDRNLSQSYFDERELVAFMNTGVLDSQTWFRYLLGEPEQATTAAHEIEETIIQTHGPEFLELLNHDYDTALEEVQKQIRQAQSEAFYELFARFGAPIET